MTEPLSDELADFVEGIQWTFAKTYARTWPHEYIVKKAPHRATFRRLAEHIHIHGYDAPFYEKTNRYFDHDGRVYWIMSEPWRATIINRCLPEQTYMARLLANDLPSEE